MYTIWYMVIMYVCLVIDAGLSITRVSCHVPIVKLLNFNSQ